MEGCGRDVKSQGWCAAHQERVRAHGHPRADVPLRGEAGVCSVPGCGRRRSGEQWCEAHRARVKAHGDPRADIPIADRARQSATLPPVHDWAVIRAVAHAVDEPCAVEPEAWFSDRAADQDAAARLCAGCPAFAACADHAASLRPSAGVWAGALWVKGEPRRASKASTHA